MNILLKIFIAAILMIIGLGLLLSATILFLLSVDFKGPNFLLNAHPNFPLKPNVWPYKLSNRMLL